MNCQDCKEKLDRFVDRELNDVDVTEIRFHLDECPDCDHRYEFQAHLKKLVKVSCERDNVPPAFREKLRKILS